MIIFELDLRRLSIIKHYRKGLGRNLTMIYVYTKKQLLAINVNHISSYKVGDNVKFKRKKIDK